ncbi:MAG: hypothetical protein EA397_17655 [Deltaproteobacteria bacterium]|nr:MAG: hypothetical protein EA397_17655 [Deltaproteobacteria bacterium]
MRASLYAWLVLAALAGCTNEAPTPQTAQTTDKAPVAQVPATEATDSAPPSGICPDTKAFGSMKQMSEGDLSSKIALAELSWSPNAIAVGATTDKTMEITAVDGKLVLVGPAASGGPELHGDPTSEGATILAYADPPSWIVSSTFESSSIPDLLAKVAAHKATTACGESDAVPFRIRGRAASLTWTTVGKPEGYTQTDTDVDVVIVGFWAPTHQGEYVPKGLDGHLHVVVPSSGLGGHLKEIELEGEVSLELPGSA